MNKPLHYDYSRCYGQDCELKEQCQRYTTMRIDENKTYISYVMTFKHSDVCSNFIEDK